MGDGDARFWNEQAYKRSIILQDTAVEARTVFRASFCPAPAHAHALPLFVVIASSDGSLAIHSIPPLHPSLLQLESDSCRSIKDIPAPKPACALSGHTGPAYDVKFYGQGEDLLLLSCGDDGRIQGFKWREISDALSGEAYHGSYSLKPILEFKNPQQKGPWEALNAMPETNALSTDYKRQHIFSACGDECAYSWDVETRKIISVFKGHSDYLHCVAARPSHNQVITGSEDGTVRIWDCRSSQCIAILDTFMSTKITNQVKLSPWVSCVALDTSENWLVSGCGGNCLTLWNLPGMDATMRIATQAPPQDLSIIDNKIVEVGADPFLSCFGFDGKVLSRIKCAPSSSYSVQVHPSGVTLVGGNAGLIDIVSEFGSHLSVFRS